MEIVEEKISGNQPELKIKAGSITATVWKNEASRNGETHYFNTITLTRSYKDKEGNWKNTNSFRTSDLPKAILVLQKVYEKLTLEV